MASSLELLDGKRQREEPLLSKIWAPLTYGGIAFAGVCFANAANRRPMLSGIQRHALFTLGAVALGNFVEKYRADYLAEKDAVLRHYVELHPEDFPTPERKKFAEVFNRWNPVR
ncbi:NADH dehydrogenase [ubiquinone] 1 subunit C2 [Schistocerca nitens]|uniref:NADH dehydrogenase [ubiquinone] 1 subunit C2 n=1 Tax=Schistocerca nitens TaxID=7011 RepID=UPI002118B1D0|nr:NADH dehydrogenase [ubiquinone] 1 subunit C2 [Schistocerca nitens]